MPDPKSVKVHKTSGTTMDIEWDDGHSSVYTPAAGSPGDGASPLTPNRRTAARRGSGGCDTTSLAG